ncbi:MAG: Dabb family protein [Congregibacter sp.]
MLQHHVFLKFKRETPALHIQEFCHKMLALKQLINEIESLEVGLDELHEERSWDLVLNMTFHSVETLRSYQKHPAHVAAMQFNAPFVESVGAVDFSK